MAKKETDSTKHKGAGARKPEDRPQGRNYLLAIAIDKYQNCTPLNNAVFDVQTFIALMKKRYNFEDRHITFIKNEKATKKRIEQAFIQLARTITPQDNLVVYFSGHGCYDPHLGGHWVPVEAGADEDDWPDYFSNDQVKNYLNRIKSFHTFLIADSCFSGTLFIDKSKEKFTGDRRETEPSRWGLTSGKKEIVSDGEPGAHSPFAIALLDVLEKADQPPSVMRICDLVLEKVAANAMQQPMGSPLAVRGHQGGQFVFHFRANERADWAEMQHTPEGLRQYLALYPGGRYREQAENSLAKIEEDLAWQQALAAQTVPALLNFESRFPQSRWVSSGEVDRLIAELEEEQFWKEATLSNSITGYREYRRRTRLGKYRQQANEAISKLLLKNEEPTAWNQAKEQNTKAAYETYLKKYPTGEHAAEAQAALRNIQLKDELAAWNQAKKQNTKAAYETYLKKYPTGKYVAEAEAAILNIHQEKERLEREKKEEKDREEKRRQTTAETARQNKIKEERRQAARQKREEQVAAVAKKLRSRWVLGSLLAIAVILIAIIGINQYGLFKGSDVNTLPQPYEADDGKFGYRDAKGNELIPAQYTYAGLFVDGQARVVLEGDTDTITINEAGKCIDNCLEDRDRNAWAVADSLDTRDAYQAYVENFKNGVFLEQARQRITKLEDLQAWNDAKSDDNLSAYKAYQKAFPDGDYAQQAGERIAKLQKTPEKPVPKPQKKETTLSAPIQKLIANMVSVAGGTFTMGSKDSEAGDDECPHSVTVSSFEIGKYEVTQAQWRAVMNTEPSYNKGCDECPVERVSWNDIQDFLKKLNALTGKRFRLPTEAEWEFAAKGGTKSQGYKYSGSNDINKVAWYGSNARSGNTFGAEKTTRPVGRKASNELGLYDMSGNVWEWCQDYYEPYPGCGGEKTTYRVLRGGSWDDNSGFCRTSDRLWRAASFRFSFSGFRLAQD